jgi:hypothetical protein
MMQSGVAIPMGQCYCDNPEGRLQLISARAFVDVRMFGTWQTWHLRQRAQILAQNFPNGRLRQRVHEDHLLWNLVGREVPSTVCD